MSRYLITGAAGFIGSHLCNSILSDGSNSVVAVDSLRSGDWGRVDNRAKPIETDIAELGQNDWLRLLDGVEVVFHLAAEKYNSSKSTPEKVIQSNVTATEHLVRASAKAGVRRVVFTSSLYAYGSVGPDGMEESDVCHPDTLYGASKLMGEGILRAETRNTGLSWNVARLFFIYGPNQFADGGYKSVIISNFERMLNGEAPIIRGDGSQSLDYVYIDDCVKALRIMSISKTDKQVTNISSGEPISINQLTEKMTHAANSMLQPVFEPSDWTFGTSRWGSKENAMIRFGWEYKTQIDSGLKSVYEWMKKQRSND